MKKYQPIKYWCQTGYQFEFILEFEHFIDPHNKPMIELV
jgi:hypothetical protein